MCNISYFYATNNKPKSKENKIAKSIAAFEKECSEEDGEHSFEVETIMDYRWCHEDVSNPSLTLFALTKSMVIFIAFLKKFQRQGMYFVKWLGYEESENTWEPLKNLDCQDKLKEFYVIRLKEREEALPKRYNNSFSHICE